MIDYKGDWNFIIMYKKSFFLMFFLIFLFSFLSTFVFYLSTTKSLSKEDIQTKNEFVRTTGLPDLALATQSTAIRHRSISDLFSIYKDDGTLREYFPTTFVYSHSKLPSVANNGNINEN